MDFRDGRSVAAGATSANILAGNAFEFAPRRPTAVVVYAAQDTPAALTDANLFTMTMLLGTSIVAQDLVVPMEADGIGPNRNEHQVASGIAAPGDRVVVTFRNGSAAAQQVRTLITFRPL